jgi:hypothetical protein
MIWRWIIRGMAIALVTLCVTAWVGSYWEEVGGYRGSGHRLFAAEIVYGKIGLGETRDLELDHSPSWHWYWYVVHPEDSHTSYPSTDYQFLGFVYEPRPSQWIVIIPLWFPTLLSTMLLWFVWRKTRPKYSGNGFPVEVGGKEANKA